MKWLRETQPSEKPLRLEPFIPPENEKQPTYSGRRGRTTGFIVDPEGHNRKHSNAQDTLFPPFGDKGLLVSNGKLILLPSCS